MVRAHGGLRRGSSRLGCLLQLAIVAGLAYAAVVGGEEALIYYRFQDAMKSQATFAAQKTDQQIRERLRAFTDSVKLPLSAKEISVVREGNRIRIWASYDEELKIPFGPTKIIHLRPSAEKSF